MQEGLYPTGPEHALGPAASVYFNKELFSSTASCLFSCLRPGLALVGDVGRGAPLLSLACHWLRLEAVLGMLTHPLNMLRAWQARIHPQNILSVQQVPI